MTPEAAVRDYKPLVRRQVQEHLRRWPRLASYRADLEQEGMIGLIVAARKFDPNRGIKFITYATYWVRAKIRLCVLANYGATTGRHNNGQMVAETWRNEEAAADTYEPPSAALRPDELVEFKELSEKMAEKAAEVAGDYRGYDIFMTRVALDRSYGAVRPCCSPENAEGGFPVLGAKYGFSKQRAEQIERKVAAAVRAWGNSVLAEAA